MPAPHDEVADVNRATWSTSHPVEDLAVEGWSDPGERVALLAFADRVRGGVVLDIGVGPGRTSSLLRMATSAYLAVDFLPAMVDLARARVAGIDVRVDDARSLSTVPDSSCDGVYFGFNGIDAVDHNDRSLVLASCRRVLRPGGTLLYSTLHMDGPAYRARPWSSPPLPWVVGSLAPPSTRARRLRSVLRLGARPSSLGRSLVNWRANVKRAQDGGDWAVAPNPAHEFGLLTHYTTVAGELGRLRSGGWELEQTFAAEDGSPVHLGLPRRDVRWFHVLARSVEGGRDGLGDQT